jgi:hypothetical protein
MSNICGTAAINTSTHASTTVPAPINLTATYHSCYCYSMNNIRGAALEYRTNNKANAWAFFSIVNLDAIIGYGLGTATESLLYMLSRPLFF